LLFVLVVLFKVFDVQDRKGKSIVNERLDLMRLIRQIIGAKK
jgi:hypothetical protein